MYTLHHGAINVDNFKIYFEKTDIKDTIGKHNPYWILRIPGIKDIIGKYNPHRKQWKCKFLISEQNSEVNGDRWAYQKSIKWSRK
jgi:hypothetical protein